jgi:hypothetical protein
MLTLVTDSELVPDMVRGAIQYDERAHQSRGKPVLPLSGPLHIAAIAA